MTLSCPESDHEFNKFELYGEVLPSGHCPVCGCEPAVESTDREDGNAPFSYVPKQEYKIEQWPRPAV